MNAGRIFPVTSRAVPVSTFPAVMLEIAVERIGSYLHLHTLLQRSSSGIVISSNGFTSFTFFNTLNFVNLYLFIYYYCFQTTNPDRIIQLSAHSTVQSKTPFPARRSSRHYTPRFTGPFSLCSTAADKQEFSLSRTIVNT